MVAAPVHLTAEQASIDAGQGIVEDDLSIPYLFTGFTTLLRDIPAIRPPNLMLVFATPVRVPPLRRLEYLRVWLPFGYISSRAEKGVTVDGALLCATDADALHQLASSGVSTVHDWRAWRSTHPRDEATIRRDRKAAEQHFTKVTQNLLVVWVLFLILAVTAIIVVHQAM